MKTAISFATCLLIATSAVAQNNIIKLNVSSAVLKNFHVQYERQVSEKKSFAIGLRYQPAAVIPLRQFLDGYIANSDVHLGSFITSNFSITPEFRFYAGKRGGLTGFYVAPYLRFAKWSGNLPVSYESETEKRQVALKGSINSFSGGIMVGSQYNLSSRLVFDWWIAGGHIGLSSGNGSYTTSPAMNRSEQEILRNKLSDLDFWFVRFKADVGPNGGTATTNGLWAGVRAFGFNLCYRF